MKNILVLAGASGVGKTTLAMKLLNADLRFSYVRSITTRKARKDEFDSEYIYVTKDEFKNKIEQNEILEYMEYGDNLYGTPVSEIERIFDDGKIPLLILDLNGIVSLKTQKHSFEVFAFYIYDELKNIEKRLYERELSKNPTVDKLEVFLRRKEANKKDYRNLPSFSENFDAFIKNEDLNTALRDIVDSYDSLSRGEARFAEEISDIANELSKSALN